jgi:hypothetical protein
MSAEAPIYFSRDLAAMRQNLFPDLTLVGVVPTLTYQATGFSDREQAIIAYLNGSLEPFWGNKDSVLSSAFVPRRNAPNTAGPCYLRSRGSRDRRKAWPMNPKNAAEEMEALLTALEELGGPRPTRELRAFLRSLSSQKYSVKHFCGSIQATASHQDPQGARSGADRKDD